jgi:RecB family exonuclease
LTAAISEEGKEVVLPTRISPSALSRYLACPKQFLLQDIERLSPREQTTPVLVKGNAVHHTLERFMGLPLDERQPENLERILRAVWPEHRKPEAFATRDEEARCGQEAIEMLQRFAESADLEAMPLVRERWVKVRLGGFEMYGKVDRVDRTRSGGLDLIDYKTGASTLEGEDLKHQPAVQVYVLGTEAISTLPVERVRFVYVALGTEAVWECEREDIEWLGERLAQRLDTLRNDSEFVARPSSACRFCPVAFHCPDSQHVELEELIPVEGLPF